MEIICPECESKNPIKHSRINGKQRYKCTFCGRTFNEDSTIERYTKKDLRFLSMIVNFLDSEPQEGRTLKDYLNEAKEEWHPCVRKIKSQEHDYSKDDRTPSIQCYNPRVIICKNDQGEIDIIKLPTCSFEEDSSTQTITMKIFNSNKHEVVKKSY